MVSTDNVALYLDFKDINALYAATKHPRILQEISGRVSDIKDILFTTVDRGDSLIDNRPSCECTASTSDNGHGNGDICDICLTPVMPITERSVTPSLYLATPHKVEDFLYPYLYQSLRTAFNIGTSKVPYNPFSALMGRQTPNSPLHRIYLNRMPKELLGYNNAVANLPDYILNLVEITFDIISPKERGVITSEIHNAHRKANTLFAELFQARDLANSIKHFNLPYKSKFLPVRSKLLMTLEEGTNSATSQTTDLYARAIVYLNNMPYDESKMTPRDKSNYRPESKMIRFYEQYANFRDLWYKEEGQKGGAMRTESITSRSGLVLRSVQSQNCEPHQSEDLGLPYSQTIVVFLAHIVHWYKTNRGWGTDKIIQFVEANLRSYNQELWEVLSAILKEVTEKGGVAYSIRYPSIYRTSGLTNRIAFVKKDPLDTTLAVPASSLAGQSGDCNLKVALAA